MTPSHALRRRLLAPSRSSVKRDKPLQGRWHQDAGLAEFFEGLVYTSVPPTEE
jgi:hypothetical protein